MEEDYIERLNQEMEAIKNIIYDDFQTFVVLFLWKQWVDSNIDSKRASGKFLSTWKDKVLKQHSEKIKKYKEEFEEINKFSKKTLLLDLPSPNEIEASFNEAVNEVISEIKKISKLEPWDEYE